MISKQLRSMGGRRMIDQARQFAGIVAVTAILIICQTISADAFGPTGHRVVAKIAEANLTPRANAVVRELLGSQSLVQISTWADEIRSDPRWRRANPWHYVSIKDGGTYSAKPMKGPDNPRDIIQGIEHFRAVLKDKSRPKQDRVQALKWIVHLVADIHQPLHVGRKSDKGGNDIKATWFGSPTNVHAIWDEGLIQSTKLSYTELTGFINKATEDQKDAWGKSDVLDWAKESMSYREQAYAVPRPDRSGSYAYAFKHLPLVKLRLNQAGIRLAAMLNAILDDGAEAAMEPALHWQRNSAEYRGLAFQTYAMASARLTALHKSGELANKSWAVILDADETIVDNSQYQKERRGRPYTKASWVAWCRRVEAGAIPGVIQFLNLVRQYGGHIAVVSNRPVEVQKSTEQNLKKIKAPFDVVLLRQGNENKEARWAQVRNGGGEGKKNLEVLMYFGDNITDFPGLSQKAAKKGPELFSQFGRQFFLLPNPVYGSWERNKAQ